MDSRSADAAWKESTAADSGWELLGTAVSVPAVRRRRRLLWAWAASAVGAAVWAAGLVLIIFTYSGRTSPAVALEQIHTGQCLTGSDLSLDTDQAWPDQIQLVPCSRPHLAEALFADALYWTGPYPGDSALSKRGYADCAAAFAAYVGISATESKYVWDYTTPSATDWKAGDRELLCVAYLPTSSNPGGIPITGSIKNSRR